MEDILTGCDSPIADASRERRARPEPAAGNGRNPLLQQDNPEARAGRRARRRADADRLSAALTDA
jgi:hypothetical protein